MVIQTISRQTLHRLPLYLSYLKALPQEISTVSATGIADALKLGQVQVRKDLASVSTSGRPKVGYVTRDLIEEIEAFLGYDNVNDAVIVGAGRLGKAFMGYQGFKAYGLSILAAFDTDPRLAGTEEAGKPIFPMSDIGKVCERLGVHIGILTVPADAAQSACDQLIASGVLAIWNFAPTRLVVPDGVLVQNENMASSLAILSNHLAKRLIEKEL